MILSVSVLEEDLSLLFDIFNIPSEEAALHVFLLSDHVWQFSERGGMLIASERRLEEIDPSKRYDPVYGALILEYNVRVYIRPATTPTVHSDILVLIYCEMTLPSRQVIHSRDRIELYT